jgi:hypothetical protein
MMSKRDRLHGIHRMHCLCYDCKKFKPENRAENCKTANLVNITPPVWGCPEFKEKESEE